ncbi:MULTISPECIES: TrkA C-terminal domain-containing protein [unclassified Lebetimonas]|uniref:TrkA C-terminal domain-containing protein n=1 Tax=unclassified Lebetimonas TaxID=2648158 RepID=UPI000464D50E|nr:MULTISPECIES: potassium transporter TrkA [unclassified Lebetimonas]
MNKIVLFAGAKESKILIEKIASSYVQEAEYYIIYEKEDEITKIEKENFFYYKIPFFAFELYRSLFFKDINKIIVYIKNKKTAEFVINKIKNYSSIVFAKFWENIEIPLQNNIEIIDNIELITNKILDHLPDVPLFARDIGLGIGEILEVEIPPHSVFAYKNPNFIQRWKNIKIAVIYRENKFIIPSRHTLILPNDKLLLIGEPEKLKSFFIESKKNLGAFPAPYGRNIYLLIDMQTDKKTLYNLLKSALFLHRKLKNQKLIIKLINPKLNFKIYKLYKFKNIDIYTDYFSSDYEKTLKNDTNIYNIGLVITNNGYFYKYKKTFFDIKIPVFKQGNESIKKCKEFVILLQDKMLDRIAPSIFDLSFQLNLGINFLEPFIEEKDLKELKEYLEKFAKVYNFKKITFTKTQKNPIIKLKTKENICIIEPFISPPVLKIFQIFNPKIYNAYIMLDKFSQFLIPVK